MTTDRGALAAPLATMALATMMLAATTLPAMAQTEPAAPVRGLERLQATEPTPDTSAIPVPAAPTIVLPTAKPTPRPSRPRATAAPAPERPAARETTRDVSAGTPRTRAPAAEPQLPPAAQPTPTPATTTTPEPVATPQPGPSVAPATETAAPAVAPTATPAAQPTITAPETGRAMPLWLSLAVIVMVLAGLWLLRRKPRNRGYDRAQPKAFVEPIPEPVAPATALPVIATPLPKTPTATVPVAPAVASAPKFLEPRVKTPPPPPAAPRARLTCDLRPLRAGLNMLSATVECELVVTNTGNAAGEAIRVGVALLTAHAGQDTDLAQFNAAPIGRPATPPFALAPGETRTIRTVTAIAREAIRTMTAANRPMFVPVVAANIRYATAGEDAQTARAWVVGIERVDSPKLAPFWLDAPARMFTTVAARPHAAEFDS